MGDSKGQRSSWGSVHGVAKSWTQLSGGDGIPVELFQILKDESLYQNPRSLEEASSSVKIGFME